jgi:hypothetical protein
MRHAFEIALESAGRPPEPASIAPSPQRSLAGLVSSLDAPPAASHSLWEFAAAWTPEADPPPAPPAPPEPPRPSACPEDIARELGLERLRNAADIARARRRFMWDNHPDRRGDLDHALANARVAAANMLLDRVRARLATIRRQ